MTRSRTNPKLLIARAAAPMFRGLREATSTTQRFALSFSVSKPSSGRSHRLRAVCTASRRKLNITQNLRKRPCLRRISLGREELSHQFFDRLHKDEINCCRAEHESNYM